MTDVFRVVSDNAVIMAMVIVYLIEGRQLHLTSPQTDQSWSPVDDVDW